MYKIKTADFVELRPNLNYYDFYVRVNNCNLIPKVILSALIDYEFIRTQIFVFK